MLDQKLDTKFQEIIDAAYEDTSTVLIEILMRKYKLLDHFNSLRRYLLLGQGDFINHLMELMELVKSVIFIKNNFYTHRFLIFCVAI